MAYYKNALSTKGRFAPHSQFGLNFREYMRNCGMLYTHAEQTTTKYTVGEAFQQASTLVRVNRIPNIDEVAVQKVIASMMGFDSVEKAKKSRITLCEYSLVVEMFRDAPYLIKTFGERNGPAAD